MALNKKINHKICYVSYNYNLPNQNESVLSFRLIDIEDSTSKTYLNSKLEILRTNFDFFIKDFKSFINNRKYTNSKDIISYIDKSNIDCVVKDLIIRFISKYMTSNDYNINGIDNTIVIYKIKNDGSGEMICSYRLGYFILREENI